MNSFLIKQSSINKKISVETLMQGFKPVVTEKKLKPGRNHSLEKNMESSANQNSKPGTKKHFSIEHFGSSLELSIEILMEEINLATTGKDEFENLEN